MLRRILLIAVLTVLLFSFVAVPINTKAYVSPSSLYTYSCYTSDNNSFSFKPSYDGVYLIHTLYKSHYSPDTINSPVKLNNSYFSSGTWNGQNVSELDSKYLYNIDVTGFSQSVSYSDKGDYFIYSMITCLPVKAGDNFSVMPSSNTTNVRESSYFFYASYIPGGSGCKMVHVEEGNSHPENSLTYTVKSKNQHLAVVFDSDTFLSSDRDFRRSSSLKCSSYSELTSIGCFGNCLDIFTTSYNYTGDISVTLKDTVKNYSFSVYEILTDGTTTPGYVQEPEKPTGSGGSDDSGGGSSGDDETSKGIFDTVKNIFSKLKDISQNIADIPSKIANSISDLGTNIIDNIKNAVQDFKDYLVYLFVPSDNNFTKCQELIEEKFKFVKQVQSLFKSFWDSIYSDEPSTTFYDGVHGGGGSSRGEVSTFVEVFGFKISLIDWQLYEDYKVYVDAIFIAFSYYIYLKHLFYKLPGIIGGFQT